MAYVPSLFLADFIRIPVWHLHLSRNGRQTKSRGSGGPSGAHILSHHPGILMFEDVTVIHEGMLPRRGMIEGNQKLGLVLDEDHVLPTRQMSGRWRALE
jgi:hypothetical protein